MSPFGHLSDLPRCPLDVCFQGAADIVGDRAEVRKMTPSGHALRDGHADLESKPERRQYHNIPR